MVSEQGEQIQRIDADTDEISANVEAGQRELLKYWGRVKVSITSRFLYLKHQLLTRL